MQSSVTDDASTVAELGLVRTTNQMCRACKSLSWNLGNDTTQWTQRTLPAPTCYRLVADLLRGSRKLHHHHRHLFAHSI